MKKKTSKHAGRTGFRKISQVDEWSIQGDLLIWRGSTEKSFTLSELCEDNGRTDEPFVPYQNERALLKKITNMIRHRNEYSVPDRYLFLKSSHVMSLKLFYQVAEELLQSKKWTDGEKLYFLIWKLPFLSGFDHGIDLEKLLLKIVWKSKLLKDRMQELHAAVKLHGLIESKIEMRASIDAEVVENMSDKITLYRGFNVPLDESVRDKNVSNWLKQACGKSVYYTMHEDLARWFAWRQKTLLVRSIVAGHITPEHGRALLGGRLTVAKYEVDRDDIIFFNDWITRTESECICLPRKVNLVDYKFMGYDDAVKIQNSKRPIMNTKHISSHIVNDSNIVE